MYAGPIAGICRMARAHVLTDQELMQWRRLSVEHMFHYACCDFCVCPKFHDFQHLPQHILMAGVPRTYWVYSDEAKKQAGKDLVEQRVERTLHAPAGHAQASVAAGAGVLLKTRCPGVDGVGFGLLRKVK